MFVVTIKSKLKKIILFCIIALAISAVAFAGLYVIFNTPSDTAFCESTGTYSTKAENKKDIEGFLYQFSLETDELCSEEEITIPYIFNDTYVKYNELQKKQGLDLQPHKGKVVTCCIYSLKNQKIDYTDAYVTIIVYKGRVIAGHISTGVQDSAVYTFFGE